MRYSEATELGSGPQGPHVSTPPAKFIPGIGLPCPSSGVWQPSQYPTVTKYLP